MSMGSNSATEGETSTIDLIQEKLDYADAVANWFLEMGGTYNHDGQLEDALKCTNTAAWILARQNRSLSCERLESTLRFIAEQISLPSTQDNPPARPVRPKPTCLHVLSEVLPAGGITALATRWMTNDCTSGCIHSAVLLAQQSPVPEEFNRAVRDTGGELYVANPSDSFVITALWLRNLTRDRASYVFLHVAFADIVLCGAAFGVSGGPPILLVNHSANLFWPGASFVDLVVNIRGSNLERAWTAVHRGIPRCATVPIPLTWPRRITSDEESDTQVKARGKRALGIAPDATVILTVGAHFKYLPTNELDFVAVLEGVMRPLPNVYLLVAGFEPDRRWKEASARLQDRIKVLGTVSQARLAEIHQATDIYVEGFPFGTTTALLEAGIMGIPVVLAPAQCPPPYGSDGVALDGVLQRARTLEEYGAIITRLASDPCERQLLGEKICASIVLHHTGAKWNEYLAHALAVLPRDHRTYCQVSALRTPSKINEHWSKLVTMWNSPLEETFDNAVVRALSMGVRPRVTEAMLHALRLYRSKGISCGVPVGIATLLCNFAFHVVPIAWARETFRALSFLYRPFLVRRVLEKLGMSSSGSNSPRRWYEEYRTVGLRTARVGRERFRSSHTSARG